MRARGGLAAFLLLVTVSASAQLTFAPGSPSTDRPMSLRNGPALRHTLRIYALDPPPGAAVAVRLYGGFQGKAVMTWTRTFTQQPAISPR